MFYYFVFFAVYTLISINFFNCYEFLIIPQLSIVMFLCTGRAYNISVQTVSDSETSLPTRAQYRTIPLRPYKFTYDPNSVTSHSFKVTWEPPNGVRFVI